MSDETTVEEGRLAEVVSMREKFAEDNEKAIQALLGGGMHPMAINATLLRARLETFIEALLPEGMHARDAYETAAVVRVRADLAEMMSQLREHILAQPASGLIVPTPDVPPDLSA